MDSADYRYQFIAGNLALDLVNTVAFRSDPHRRKDRLESGEDARRWAQQAQLPEWTAGSGPGVGTTALRRIRAVREQMFGIFHAIAMGHPIPQGALSQLSDAFHNCSGKRHLSSGAGEVRWEWQASARSEDYLLYAVLAAAIELLTSESRGSIRQCEDACCGWMFLDRSNARKRRWCSMADCGNRNKVRRYYERQGADR